MSDNFLSQKNLSLSDGHMYSVEHCQEHQVTAKWSKEKVPPGAGVTLTVKAEVN